MSTTLALPCLSHHSEGAPMGAPSPTNETHRLLRVLLHHRALTKSANQGESVVIEPIPARTRAVLDLLQSLGNEAMWRSQGATHLRSWTELKEIATPLWRETRGMRMALALQLLNDKVLPRYNRVFSSQFLTGPYQALSEELPQEIFDQLHRVTTNVLEETLKEERRSGNPCLKLLDKCASLTLLFKHPQPLPFTKEEATHTFLQDIITDYLTAIWGLLYAAPRLAPRPRSVEQLSRISKNSFRALVEIPIKLQSDAEIPALDLLSRYHSRGVGLGYAPEKLIYDRDSLCMHPSVITECIRRLSLKTTPFSAAAFSPPKAPPHLGCCLVSASGDQSKKHATLLRTLFNDTLTVAEKTWFRLRV